MPSTPHRSAGNATHGFPLKQVSTVRVNEMTITTTSSVTNIQRRAIDASQFAAPADYTKVDDPITKMMRQMTDSRRSNAGGLAGCSAGGSPARGFCATGAGQRPAEQPASRRRYEPSISFKISFASSAFAFPASLSSADRREIRRPAPCRRDTARPAQDGRRSRGERRRE